MTEIECYRILDIKEDASLAIIKKAYRRLAFSFHPDLNPQLKDGGRRFQLLNEAYVTLTELHEQNAREYYKKARKATERRRHEAHKAYEQAKRDEGKSDPGFADFKSKEQAKASRHADKEKEHVISDLLKDPFARRVFEDIYSRLKKNEKRPHVSRMKAETVGSPKDRYVNIGANSKDEVGIFHKVKGWFRRQIDDEQVLKLPGTQLVPGARVRMQIQYGLSNEPQTIEITLPPEFEPGKTMRLKGMGKRVGKLAGDLYVRIDPS